MNQTEYIILGLMIILVFFLINYLIQQNMDNYTNVNTSGDLNIVNVMSTGQEAVVKSKSNITNN